jgi:hypothetical protein
MHICSSKVAKTHSCVQLLGSGSGSGSKALPNAQSVIAGGRIAKPLRGGGGTTSTTTTTNKTADSHDQGNTSTSVQSPGNSKTHNSSPLSPEQQTPEKRASSGGLWGLFRSGSSSGKRDDGSPLSPPASTATPVMQKSASRGDGLDNLK